ncbi:MAG TPA: PorV/PorQ family protein [Bacteroidota bacterium]|nr:PorV/PorQ family protein [Bacteroidota bacterium]
MKNKDILFAILFFTATGFAQNGSVGLTFLKLGVGARALGMGEAYSPIANDPTAIHYNPATLSLSKNSQLLLMHKEWIQDTRSEFLGATTSIDEFSFGVGIYLSSVDNIEIRNIPGPALATFTSRNAAMSIAASYKVNPSLSFGLTGKYLYEKIFIDEATGYGIDMGALYQTPFDINLAIAVNNIGSMDKLREESSKLPTIVRFGGSYEMRINSLDGILTAVSEIVKFTGEDDVHGQFGVEFNYKNSFAVRTGYQSGFEAKNLSMGVGIKHDILRIDYAYVPFRYQLGSTHTISLGFEF